MRLTRRLWSFVGEKFGFEKRRALRRPAKPRLEMLEDRITPSTTGVLDWIRQFGGTSPSNEVVLGTATDSSSNVYVAGYTDGTLPGQTGAGGDDAFVRKYDTLGNVAWTQQFGTSASDVATAVTVDGSGNVYVAGYTQGNVQGTNAGNYDAFVRKFDSSGNVLWTQQFGTSGSDFAEAVATDSAGNVYVGGSTSGSLQGTNTGGTDAFLRKFNSAGTVLWTQQLGTANTDVINAITVFGTNNVYVAGETAGSLQGSNAGGYDVFVRSYDGSGNVQWTRQEGSSSYDYATGLATDSSGNLFVAGYTAGALPGQTSAGSYDAFVQQYNSSGNLQWTQQFGTSGNDFAQGVAVDASGNVYVGGVTSGNLQGTNAGNYDAFLRKFNNAGAAQWTWQLGGRGNDQGQGVAVDGSGNIYLGGYTDGTLLGQTSAGSNDGFLAKFSDSSAPPQVFATSPNVTAEFVPAGSTSLQVFFNQPAVGANQASNYILQSAGPDGLLGTADDVNVPISSVTFTGSTAATLNFFSPLPEGVYRLTVKANITSTGGTALAGDGTPGDNYVRDFVAAFSPPVNLTSSNNYDFDVQGGGYGAGQLVQGTNNAFDGLNRLQVGGTDYNPTLLAEETVATGTSPANTSFQVPGSPTMLPVGQGQIPNPGVPTSVNLPAAATVRLDATVGLYINANPSYPAVAFQFYVDGAPVGTPQYFATNYYDQTITVTAFAPLAAGAHTVTLEAANPYGYQAYLQYWNENGLIQPYAVTLNVSVPLPMAVGILANGGQTLVTNTQTLAGLNVSRQVTVPNTGSQDFARTVDYFQNPTSSPITTTVHIAGNLGSDAATRVFATSSGDSSPSPNDIWFGTDGGPGTTAVISMVHGPAGLVPTTEEIVGDNIEWTYNITVPANSILELASFTIQASSESSAIAEAKALVTPLGFGGQASEFLSANDLTALANFQFQAATTTSISDPTVTYNANGVVTVTVSAPAGVPTPTGTVTLVVDGNNGSPLSATLNGSGVATFTLTSPGAGSHSLLASYAAQGNYAASSSTGSLVVNQAATTTSINASTVTYNANGVVTVTISAPAGVPAPSGTVTLVVDGNNGSPLSATLNGSGVATFTLTSPSAGSHNLSVSYASQGNYAASSATGTLVVNQAATTTSISAPTVTYNANGVVTVTIGAPTGIPAPGGTVTLVVDGNQRQSNVGDAERQRHRHVYADESGGGRPQPLGFLQRPGKLCRQLSNRDLACQRRCYERCHFRPANYLQRQRHHHRERERQRGRTHPNGKRHPHGRWRQLPDTDTQQRLGNFHSEQPVRGRPQPQRHLYSNQRLSGQLCDRQPARACRRHHDQHQRADVCLQRTGNGNRHCGCGRGRAHSERHGVARVGRRRPPDRYTG
jgi:hypothetical protein